VSPEYLLDADAKCEQEFGRWSSDARESVRKGRIEEDYRLTAILEDEGNAIALRLSVVWKVWTFCKAGQFCTLTP